MGKRREALVTGGGNAVKGFCLLLWEKPTYLNIYEKNSADRKLLTVQERKTDCICMRRKVETQAHVEG